MRSQIRAWIELPEEENPVIHYNLDKENFILVISTNFQLQMLQRFGTSSNSKICIDSTHCTNEYGLQLTTIVVVDEFGNGFPCAYCISKKTDAVTWKIFFQQIKNKIGIISTQIFMSDDDPSYYNAWEQIMLPVEHRLLCTWHVDQSWRRNIQSKIKGTPEKKCLIYKSLRVMHQEPNEILFTELLNGFMAEIMDDDDTIQFGEYFNSYYLNRVKQWAYCHRRNCGINTNMYLESVHKCLKYYYLHGKKNKRLDTCINALLKFTRNTIFERFIKLVKNKYTAKEENIIKSHNIGVQINPETIKVIDDNRWEISAKETNMAYEVIHTIDVCNTEDCRLVCRMCNICIHNYTCECSDYIIKLNICKHIHACANLSVSNTQNNLCEKEKKILIPAAEINLIEKSIVKTNTDKEHEQLIQIKNQLEAGIGVLSSLIASKSEVTEKEISEMNKHSSSLLQILQGKRKIIEIEKNKEPVNKNIDKQKRFETKKRKVELLSGRIESNERKSLKEGLVLGEVQNIHTSNDHTY